MAFRKMNSNIKKKIDYKYILVIIVMSIISSYMIIYFPPLLRIIGKFFIMIIVFKFLFSQDIAKTTISVFLLYLLFVVSEVTVTLFLINFFNITVSFLQKDVIGILLGNIIILMEAFFLFFVFWRIALFRNIIKWYSEKYYFNLFFLVLVGIFAVVYISRPVDNRSFSDYLVNYVFIFSMIIFIVYLLRERMINNRLSSEYDQLLDYIKTYEKVLSKSMKNQHEYQNQLVVIREMVQDRKKDPVSYINNLLHLEEQAIDSKWLVELKNMPDGGLKGLIHYKIDKMNTKNIQVFIDISEDLNKEELWELSDKNLTDITKVVGVYLDNAIEATNDAKIKYIMIEGCLNNGKIDFTFSNTYAGSIDVQQVDNEGYSTKGKGKGYGLGLVKDIINRNKLLEQRRELNGPYYVQHLIIDPQKRD